MALFGTPNAYLGLDIGTSALKVVELLDRRRRHEVAAYGEANLPNLLVNPPGNPEDAVRKTANAVTQLLEAAGVATDAVVAALPSGIVFSTVLELPKIPDKDMAEAVQFAARDVVPANIDDMVIGYSRVGELPHMADDSGDETEQAPAEVPAAQTLSEAGDAIPVFMTAAPKDVVERYSRVMELVKLELVALEVETFPLVRSLLPSERDSALLVDIGDQATTFHVIDQGTPRLSHSVDGGGSSVTEAIAQALDVDTEEAHSQKVQFGLVGDGPVQRAARQETQELIEQAQRLLRLHAKQSGRAITKTVLIGGGAKLRGIADVWGEAVRHKTLIGNPWRGLSYPNELTARIQGLGPTFGVAVGLAQRGLQVHTQ